MDRADRAARHPVPPHPAGHRPRPAAELEALPAADPAAARFAAAFRDPDAFRGMLVTLMCLAQQQEVFARPAVRAAMAAVGDAGPVTVPGPDRAELLELLAA